METRINKLEQQMISRNIEIKNIINKEISPLDVVKTIGSSINVEIKDEDIIKAIRLKKIEFMSKIVKHRIDSNVINNNSFNNKFIYVNDQLTFENRRLLWIAKTKAKEANWKFVWVRGGNIYARKTENSPLFAINSTTDIELINNKFINLI